MLDNPCVPLEEHGVIDDICDQLSSHIPQELHDLVLWTKGEQVTTAAIRMQEAMNLISDWAKEWLVMINRTTCFSLSPKTESSFCRSMDKKSTSKTPPTYQGVKVDRQPTWSPHIMHHAQQSSWENGSHEETGRNKMGSQHGNLDPGLHRNCQTPHGVCLQCLVICCKD